MAMKREVQINTLEEMCALMCDNCLPSGKSRKTKGDKNMINLEPCCGNCKWHKQDENFKEDWICCNDKSKYVADWTSAEDVCDEYESED